MKNEQQMREAFEKWFAEFYKVSWPTDPKEFALVVWQAALSKPAASVEVVERGKKVREEWSGYWSESHMRHLSMLITRIAYRHNKGLSIEEQIKGAMDYLQRNNLQGSPLRDDITLPAQPSTMSDNEAVLTGQLQQAREYNKQYRERIRHLEAALRKVSRFIEAALQKDGVSDGNKN